MSEERVSWKDSNLALIGSDLDHKIKKAAAEGEAAWEGIGQEAMLKIWRIEQFKVVAWPEDRYGQFHTGDSYVVLKSYQPDPDSPKLVHDLHIWIGSESSQDEYGTAAYKMVEADDFLGGAAVQHRQVQAHESLQFEEYISEPIHYLAGGVESGFHHVEATVEKPILYRVKGNFKKMSLTQMESACSSLNAGDSFILVIGKDKVYLWNGDSVRVFVCWSWYFFFVVVVVALEWTLSVSTNWEITALCKPTHIHSHTNLHAITTYQ